MSATDYADLWNTANSATHPYFQQRMINQTYYRETAMFDNQQESPPPDFYFNNYHSGIKHEQQPADVTPSTSHFRYDNFPACRQQDDAPTLRALLTKQKKPQDCNYFRQEEPNESCDYNKIDLLLSSPVSEQSSETDRESEINKQPQFYPWMKTHGKSLLFSCIYWFN